MGSGQSGNGDGISEAIANAGGRKNEGCTRWLHENREK